MAPLFKRDRRRDFDSSDAVLGATLEFQGQSLRPPEFDLVRKVTIARFEAWHAVPENVEEFFGLLETRENGKPVTFRNACVALKIPYTLMHAHVKADMKLLARYDAVLAARADQLAHERLEIADGVVPDRDHVAKAKLQIEVRGSLAAHWDRERYGERIQVDKSVSVTVDAGLLGTAADLLRVASTREEVVVGETLMLPKFAVLDSSPAESEE